MGKRLFWFAVGAGLAALIVVKEALGLDE